MPARFRSPLEPVGPLAGLSAQEWSSLHPELREVVVRDGAPLMSQGEPGTWFAVIVEGTADITRNDEDGDHQLGTVGPGSLLGEIALLTGGRRTATVTARQPLKALVGGLPAFTHLLENAALRDQLGRAAAQRLASHAPTTIVTLGDGTEVGIRPGLRSDRDQLVRGLEALSDESRRRRFFTGGRVPDRVIDYLVDIDYVDHFAWVAVALPGDHIVGSARYVRDSDDPSKAEIAFGVLDDFQRHGIGTILVGALAATAPAAGITHFTASVLRENAPARNMLEQTDVEWDADEPGVATTVISVDDIRARLDADLLDDLETVGANLITASQLALT